MNITDAAKQAGIDPMDLPDVCREVVWVATIKELERFAKIIRNQALEDAAKCCDERALKNEKACDGENEDDDTSLRSAAWQISVCAAAIRAMKKE